MKHFTIVFNEKEGTSPMVRMLDAMPDVAVLHQVEGQGWEPFDRHNCGSMRLRDFLGIVDRLFASAPTPWRAVDRRYRRRAPRPLEPTSAGCAIGYKMRFVPPNLALRVCRELRPLRWVSERLFARPYGHILARHGVVVFIAIRRDLLRWALSKYHGDGSGRRGHLQFALAQGRLAPDGIGAITVDCGRLAGIIAECRAVKREKARVAANLRRSGVTVVPICYEDFVTDKPAFFACIRRHLGLPADREAIAAAIDGEGGFRKVHSDAIADFVVNHAEVDRRFGHLAAS